MIRSVFFMISLLFIGPVSLPPTEWMLALQAVLLMFQAAMLLVAVTRLRRIEADLVSTVNRIWISPPRQDGGGRP